MRIILQKGAVLFDDGTSLTPHQYCIDFRANEETKNYDLVLAVCFDLDAEKKLGDHVLVIIPIGM